MTSPHRRHWRSAADALAALRQQPRLTRTELGARLGLDSGPTSDLVKRLTRAGLISERRAASTGPGRPTTTLHAHPDGPTALVLDLRHGDWRLATCGIDGETQLLDDASHGGDAGPVLTTLQHHIRAAADTLGDRLVGIGVAVPGPTAGDRLVHATMLGWRDVDLGCLAPAGVALMAGNDATMAAVAEARLHQPRPRSLLHLVVEIGIGGALVVDGRPVPSARGLQGEFGHLPFGDPANRCPCGALGCWTAAFDVPQIAYRVGLDIGRDPRAWLRHLFTDPDPLPEVRATREALATDLGRGTAGLVNALDPDLVTLGGLAADLRAASPEGFDRAVRSGLMTAHRDEPPIIVDARCTDEAPLVGAGLSVFDRVLDADLLARWAGRTAVAS